MRLCGAAALAKHAQCGFERSPAAVQVPALGLQDQTLGFRLEPPLSLAHERQMLDYMLVQHVLPPFRVSTRNETWNCRAQLRTPDKRHLQEPMLRTSRSLRRAAHEKASERPTGYAVSRGIRSA
jgi:hypothetical protein